MIDNVNNLIFPALSTKPLNLICMILRFNVAYRFVKFWYKDF